MDVSIVLRKDVRPQAVRNALRRARQGDEVIVIEAPGSTPVGSVSDPRLRRVQRKESLGQTIVESVTRDSVVIVRPGDRLMHNALDRMVAAMDTESVVAVGCRAVESPRRRLDPVRRTPLAIKRNRTTIVAGSAANRASLTSATELVPSSTCLLVRRSALDVDALDRFDADPFNTFPGGLVHLSRSALRCGNLALMPNELVIVPPLINMELQELRGGPAIVNFWLELLENEPGLSDLERRRGLSSLLRRVSLLEMLEATPHRLAWIRSTIHVLSARIRELDPGRPSVPTLRPSPGVTYLVASHDWATSSFDWIGTWLTLVGSRVDVCLLLPDDGSNEAQRQLALGDPDGGRSTIALLPNSPAVSLPVPALFLGSGDPYVILRTALETVV